ncbi:hypothetical protein HGRIS_003593 [Hohenbuehelia grisea]|uniref:histidine kinase n=1 Tax=Hohenbuehelia grisea TaxID=104357 RepID=A0ABR3JH00_9AGAR
MTARNARPSTAPAKEQDDDADARSNWSTFIQAYASGLWDPHRTPTSPDHNQISVPLHRVRASFSNHLHADAQQHQSSPQPLASAGTHEVQTTAATLRWAGSLVDISPLALPSPEHELTDPMRNSMAVIPGSHPLDTDQSHPLTPHITSPTVNITATSPLLLPAKSPMKLTLARRRSENTWPPNYDEPVLTPGGSRLRLSSFWEGTQDVDHGTVNLSLDGKERKKPPDLSVLQEVPGVESNPSTPEAAPAKTQYTDPPAAADYFAPAHPPMAESSPREATSDPTSALSNGSPSNSMSPSRPNPAPLQVLSVPALPFLGTHSAPAVPRRVSLTRQTSSPLPSAASNTYPSGSYPANDLFKYPYSSNEHSISIGSDIQNTTSPTSTHTSASGTPVGTLSSSALNSAVPSTTSTTPITPNLSAPAGTTVTPFLLDITSPPVVQSSPASAGKLAREEQMFRDLGYLVPPNPPDELERRRALYKFNIWNTGPDLNFDRIAHLAKLVFNTKGVVISLIDGQDQWFKSEWGVKSPSCARGHSLCAHAILQRGDEPMVILDSHLDWRFAKNPLVTGPPHIRFYAGAPLRTQEGFNIGTLMVVDDSPREDFTPRQRHTLKEFAAIAMREMELWRDKIQLRIRDRIQTSMEQFSRECLEIDSESQAQGKVDRPDLIVGASMDKVYSRAAKLVKRTLDVEGVIVMDVSHCEVLETMNAEGSVSLVMHHGESVLTESNGNGGPDAGTLSEVTTRQLTVEEYGRLNAFFAKHPDGKISENIVPVAFRPFLPTRIQYALTVPIFNIDKRPFALLCAYNASEHTKRFLEGHELSYLRAIGVIILSAVLKRRMILADKAKSLFISNISHELRTPLHGILAAAELLSESQLNHSQDSILQTIHACGTSLVETVNHVLDFTKLSGNTKAGGVEKVIVPSKVDLMQLVEEAVDGCWVGHRARTQITRDSGIGSVYSPPEKDQGQAPPVDRQHVETIVDIGHREGGWLVKCEKGGIRRVLMNLFGNSLKFTTDGYVHVVLRQLPPCEDDPPNKVRIELGVFDTGKGISQNFLKNQLFHPFSQENPLQTGTGLGLAIVHSIVHSESVDGKVDVWSEEGSGTEIRVTFSAEVPEDTEGTCPGSEPLRFDDAKPSPTVSLIGFDDAHDGVKLLRGALEEYLSGWWGFTIRPASEGLGNILILNNDPSLVVKATEQRDITRPFVILSAARGSPAIMAIASEHDRIGGFCRIVYKPGGPSRLRAVMKLCLHTFNIAGSSDGSATGAVRGDDVYQNYPEGDQTPGYGAFIPRRNSEDNHKKSGDYYARPILNRSTTAHPRAAAWVSLASTIETPDDDDDRADSESASPTISVGSGGILLKSSIGTIESGVQRFRILVVEDNSILRNLLVKWLQTKGFDFRDAVDGQDGVRVYEEEGPFDVVLIDLSMPVLDGIGATVQIRRLESIALTQTSDRRTRPARILALTGMSSLEDKRKAFEAGVDGYLVKPVAFKTLNEMFQRLGIS